MAPGAPQKPTAAAYKRMFAGEATPEEKRAILAYNLWKRTGVPPELRELRERELRELRERPTKRPTPARGLDWDRARHLVERVLATITIVEDRVYSANWPSFAPYTDAVNTAFPRGSVLIVRPIIIFGPSWA